MMPDMIPGQLANYQRDVAWRGKDADERREMTAVNLTRAGLAEEAGIISTNADPSRDRYIENEKKKREEVADAARRQLLDELEKRRAELLEELSGLRDDIAKLEEDMKAADRRIRAMNAAIGILEDGGQLERNPDGSFKDEQLEASLKAYEERTGKKVDRNDPDILLTVLREQRQYEIEQQRDRESEHDRKKRREREIETELDETERQIQAERSVDKRQEIESSLSKSDSMDQTLELTLEQAELDADPLMGMDDDILALFEEESFDLETELDHDRVEAASKAIAAWTNASASGADVNDMEALLNDLSDEVEFLAQQEGPDSPAAQYLDSKTGDAEQAAPHQERDLGNSFNAGGVSP